MRDLPRPITGRLLKTSNKISINIFVLLIFSFTLLANPLQAGELVDVDGAAMPAKSAIEAFHTQTGIVIEWSADEVDGRNTDDLAEELPKMRQRHRWLQDGKHVVSAIPRMDQVQGHLKVGVSGHQMLPGVVRDRFVMRVDSVYVNNKGV